MTFLRNPHLDLTTVHIETARCILVPFSTDGRVDLHELQEEFCQANKDFFIGPILPTYEQEVAYVEEVMRDIGDKKTMEFFVLEQGTNRLIGCVGLNRMEEHRMNIGLWIRVDEHGKGYATEVYRALLDWARENTIYSYLKHSLVPANIASRKLALKFGGVLQQEKTKNGHEIYHIPL